MEKEQEAELFDKICSRCSCPAYYHYSKNKELKFNPKKQKALANDCNRCHDCPIFYLKEHV